MLSVSAGPKLWNMVIVNRIRITGNLTVSLIKMVVAVCEKNEAENNLLGKKKKKILDLLICAAQNSCSWYSCWTSLTTGAGVFFARNVAKSLQGKSNTRETTGLHFLCACTWGSKHRSWSITNTLQTEKTCSITAKRHLVLRLRDLTKWVSKCIFSEQINLRKSDTNTEYSPVRISLKELHYHYKTSGNFFFFTPYWGKCF